MNREILFKGFHPCENGKDRVFVNGEWIKGEWVEGYLMDENYINQPFTDNDVGGRFDEPVEVIPETVGQYTGLTDKDGKKIFEGDVVKHSQKYDISGVAVSIGIVKWSNSYGAWVIADFNNGRADMFLGNEAHRVEVIGNIHDNPELLEVSE